MPRTYRHHNKKVTQAININKIGTEQRF